MQGVGPGSLLGGRYLVQRRVAQHSRYERWVAADQTLDREVVLLCFDADGPVASPALDAARRAAGVDEQRLVRVLDVGRDDAIAFVVEESLNGARSVTSVLTDGGPARRGGPPDRRRGGLRVGTRPRARPAPRGADATVGVPPGRRLDQGARPRHRGRPRRGRRHPAGPGHPRRHRRARGADVCAAHQPLATARDRTPASRRRRASWAASPPPRRSPPACPRTWTSSRGTRCASRAARRLPVSWSSRSGRGHRLPVGAGLEVQTVRRLPGNRTEPLDRDRASGGVARSASARAGRAGSANGRANTPRGATARAAGLGALAGGAAGAAVRQGQAAEGPVGPAGRAASSG